MAGIKKTMFTVRGMTRDLAASKFSPEFAYENKNLRVSAAEEETSLSMVNEKGTLLKDITWVGNYPLGGNVIGTPIGQQILDDKIVLFASSQNDNISMVVNGQELSIDDIGSVTEYELNILWGGLRYDTIYKFWFDNDLLKGTLLFSGDLNFSPLHPIESIGIYENEQLQKVYWTDGFNQPRMINIEASDVKKANWTTDSFNFIRQINLKEYIDVERNPVASGYFAPGVIQYFFSYFDLYGQETNLFYASPLLYISYPDRGASKTDTISNSFNIKISNPDINFEYIRIYSVLRTSLNATPQIKRVVDLQIPKETPPDAWLSDTNYSIGDKVIHLNRTYECKVANHNSNFEPTLWNEYYAITYTDNGNSGIALSQEDLMYVGGEVITVGTLEQKDNTLFLGDIAYNSLIIPKDIQDVLRDPLDTPTFVSGRQLDILGDFGGHYTYENQLKYRSNEIKSFKYLETYRLGLQFQYITGRWSSPVWLGDVRNTIHPDAPIFTHTTEYPLSEDKNTIVSLPIATYTHIDDALSLRAIKSIYDLGYRRVRPVVVFPTISDREVVCQGILCPTVFNADDRYNNRPFAQSSWFTRANAPCDSTRLSDSNCWRNYTDYTINATSAESKNGAWQIEDTTISSSYLNMVNRGAWAEFRHNKPLPDNTKRNAEIQSNDYINQYGQNTDPYFALSGTDADKTAKITWTSQHKNFYYVDQSVLTLHSPDIEFDPQLKTLDSSCLQLRIVGAVPLTAFVSDINIETSTSPMGNQSKIGKGKAYFGAYEEPVEVTNVSASGWKSLISAPMWNDGCIDPKSTSKLPGYVGGFFYVIYPWQRQGSLNNQLSPDEDGYTYSKLSHKVLYNSRFSYSTLYYDSGDVWNSYVKSDTYKTGITGAEVFDFDDVIAVKLPAQDSGLEDIVYYGNVDSIIVYPDANTENVQSSTQDNSGYYIITSPYNNCYDNLYNHKSYISQYRNLTHQASSASDTSYDTVATDTYTSNAPISMKYKSAPHIVLALKNSTNHYTRILPTFKDKFDDIFSGGQNETVQSYLDANPRSIAFTSTSPAPQLFWDKEGMIVGVNQDVLENFPDDGGLHYKRGDHAGYYTARFGFLWLGELYNTSVTEATRFGGQTQEALENNQWVVAGDTVSLTDDYGNIKQSITVKWTEGDTYFQRYDCLKTYPYTKEDVNSVVDIVSFMCETRVNIDGRYDRNRGGQGRMFLTKENFNLLNDTYSQENNFFTYRGTNENKLHINNFPNTITWTKTKTLGEENDTWTNVTLASTLDLDGDCGTVRSITRFNNELFAFQDSGLSQILYNENYQIASTTGVPIEIANSGKVTGKRYISNHIGCTNKWSICTTPNGIYFVDDRTKDIYVYNGQIDGLSDRLGFHTWMVNNFRDINIWNPAMFKGCITYYDKINRDVLFFTDKTTLAFSEAMGNFTSFYDYEHTPYFGFINDRGIMWHQYIGSYRPWLFREGDYNMFFNEFKPFWTTIVANPSPTTDKIFNNIEFRADSFEPIPPETFYDGSFGPGTLNPIIPVNYIHNDTFDYIEVWNEHQAGNNQLVNIQGKPSSLKKKFRMWHAQIPRNNVWGTGDNRKRRDRMRNPWLYIRLCKYGTNTYKTVLHDMIVDYYE